MVYLGAALGFAHTSLLKGSAQRLQINPQWQEGGGAALGHNHIMTIQG